MAAAAAMRIMRAVAVALTEEILRYGIMAMEILIFPLQCGQLPGIFSPRDSPLKLLPVAGMAVILFLPAIKMQWLFAPIAAHGAVTNEDPMEEWAAGRWIILPEKYSSVAVAVQATRIIILAEPEQTVAGSFI